MVSHPPAFFVFLVFCRPGGRDLFGRIPVSIRRIGFGRIGVGIGSNPEVTGFGRDLTRQLAVLVFVLRLADALDGDHLLILVGREDRDALRRTAGNANAANRNTDQNAAIRKAFHFQLDWVHLPFDRSNEDAGPSTTRCKLQLCRL